MATYIANKNVLIAHLGREALEGEIFTTDFPEGFKPEPNLTLVPEEKPVKVKADKVV